MTIKLRDYQTEAIDKTFRHIVTGGDRGLWVMPTGCGKTVIFTELLRQLAVPTIILVHRDELVKQTGETIKAIAPKMQTTVVKGVRNDWSGDVVVASVQSLRENRLKAQDPKSFELLIADEAHHASAPTWERAIEYFQTDFRLGVTATPDRLDGKGLAHLFGEDPVYVYNLRKAIDDGWLSPPRQFAVQTGIDLSDVKKRAGDFAVGELSEAVNTDVRNDIIIDAWLKHASKSDEYGNMVYRKTIAFCVDVRHARDLSESFAGRGISSAYIYGDMDHEDRVNILAAFKQGFIDVLCNVNIATEGYDEPSIACVLMCRPTQSRALYTQAVGRGLRLFDGKDDCLILDVTDNSSRHKLMCATNLLGKEAKDAEGKFLTEVADDEEKEAEEKDKEFREWNGAVKWRLQSICPWPELPDIKTYNPKNQPPWHHDLATPKQLSAISKFGLEIDTDVIRTKGEAAHILQQCFDYAETHPTPPTPAQEWRLRNIGRWEEGLTRKEAGKRIGEWKSKTITFDPWR